MSTIQELYTAVCRTFDTLGLDLDIKELRTEFEKEWNQTQDESEKRRIARDVNIALIGFLPDAAQKAFDQMLSDHPTWKFAEPTRVCLQAAGNTNQYLGWRVAGYTRVFDSVQKGRAFFARKAEDAKRTLERAQQYQTRVPASRQGRFAGTVAHLNNGASRQARDAQEKIIDKQRRP